MRSRRTPRVLQNRMKRFVTPASVMTLALTLACQSLLLAVAPSAVAQKRTNSKSVSVELREADAPTGAAAQAARQQKSAPAPAPQAKQAGDAARPTSVRVKAVRTARVNLKNLEALEARNAAVRRKQPAFQQEIHSPGTIPEVGGEGASQASAEGDVTPAPAVEPQDTGGPLVPSPAPAQNFLAQEDGAKVGTGTFTIPPDTMGAVGFDKVFVNVNNNYRVQNKATGAPLSTVSIDTFWTSTGATGVFDPRIQFDPYQNRWLLSAVSNAQTANSSVLVGVSDTSDPQGAYTLFRIVVGCAPGAAGCNAQGEWADFPMLGFNKNWIAVGWNQFTINTSAFVSGKMLVLDYPTLRTGTANGTLFTNASGGDGDFCMHPATTLSATEETLYVPAHVSSAGANYRLHRITGTSAAPVFTLDATLRTRTGGGWTQPGGDNLPQQCVPGVGAPTQTCPASPMGLEASGRLHPLERRLPQRQDLVSAVHRAPGGRPHGRLALRRAVDGAQPRRHFRRRRARRRRHRADFQRRQALLLPVPRRQQARRRALRLLRVRVRRLRGRGLHLPPRHRRRGHDARPRHLQGGRGLLPEDLLGHAQQVGRLQPHGRRSRERPRHVDDSGVRATTRRHDRAGVERLALGHLVGEGAGARGRGRPLISEFRVRGPNPNGANNEFIEIYNATGAPLTVTTLDGSAGYSIAASDGVARCTIPSGTVIPARGHYLCVNSVGYSLASHPAGNGTTATGDATYTTDIPDNAGIALFNTATAANFTLANRLDAVGSTSEANTLYKEGTGYPALTPFNIDHSFYRDDCGKGGSITTLGLCPTGGFPKDTNNNAADFVFVDTNGTSAGAGQRLGSPGPENLSSPVQRNNVFPVVLLDASVAGSSPPNRIRDFTSDPANNSTFGTLDIRRRVVNATGAPGHAPAVPRRRSDDLPGAVGLRRPAHAHLDAGRRLRHQRRRDVSRPTARRAPCTVNVQGTTLEQPPSQPNGGAFNGTYSAGTITLATPLANGASINVRFLLGIQQTGTFKFFINVEALP